MSPQTRNLWFVFRRSEDVLGEWVGHCPDLDVVSQGPTLQRASEMLWEACAGVLDDDSRAGRDPLDRRAERSVWDSLYNAISLGYVVDFTSLYEARSSLITCLALVSREVGRASVLVEIPLAWETSNFVEDPAFEDPEPPV